MVGCQPGRRADDSTFQCDDEAGCPFSISSLSHASSTEDNKHDFTVYPQYC